MKLLIILASVFINAKAFAHGEDKPGPHGGKIEMAKNVHTEVNADKDGSFHIFLLDGNIENPTVKNSSLEATIKSMKKEIKLNCSVMGGSHFHCKSREARPKEGQLFLKAKRENVHVDIVYDLAAFNENPKPQGGHEHH